jgi:hypothetical protein
LKECTPSPKSSCSGGRSDCMQLEGLRKSRCKECGGAGPGGAQALRVAAGPGRVAAGQAASALAVSCWRATSRRARACAFLLSSRPEAGPGSAVKCGPECCAAVPGRMTRTPPYSARALGWACGPSPRGPPGGPNGRCEAAWWRERRRKSECGPGPGAPRRPFKSIYGSMSRKRLYCRLSGTRNV